MTEYKTPASLFYFCIYTTAATPTTPGTLAGASSAWKDSNSLGTEPMYSDHDRGRRKPKENSSQNDDEDDDGGGNNSILYFYPPTFQRNDRLKQVGLAQALVHFTRTFHEPGGELEALPRIQSVHSQKHRLCFHHCEPGICMLLNVNLGFLIRHLGKEGRRQVEFLDASVDSDTLLTILNRAYHYFVLLHGSLRSLLTYSAPNRLALLQAFFPRFLEQHDWSRLTGFTDSLDGLLYAHLPRTLYLDLLSAVQPFQEPDPDLLPVQHTLCLFRKQLVWSDLTDREWTRWIFLYLTRFRIHPSMWLDEGVLADGDPGVRGFITVPDTLAISSDNREPLLVYLDDRPYIVLLYQVMDCVLALLCRDEPHNRNQLQLGQTYKRLDGILRDRMGNLVRGMHKFYAQMKAGNNQVSVDRHYRFLYFNRINLAVRSLGEDVDEVLASAGDLMPTLKALRSQLRSTKAMGPFQLFAKTNSEFWMVGYRSGDREIYVVVSKRDATLPEVEQEVHSILKHSLSTAIFLE